jgi:biopolymer transport protein ExbB
VLDQLLAIFRAGGPVMWPLLLLSLVSVTLGVERAAFWLRTHSGRTRRAMDTLLAALRRADPRTALGIAESDPTVYGRMASATLTDALAAGAMTEPDALQHVERVRPTVERFGTVLATIIAAAPLLGILGTVTGIISSFQLLGGAQTVTDPVQVAAGIAEALYTTAFGLIVALVTLFPYAIFRGQSERCLSRLETLAASIAATPLNGRRSADA